MSVSTLPSENPRSDALARIGYAIGIIAIALLAYFAVRFYLRDPLHYIVDHSEASFGRYWSHKWSLLLHIAGGTLALFAGPFQLWSGLRRRHLAVHRWTGRLYITGVLLGGVASFYLALHTVPRDFGVALFVLATAWWTTVGMAIVAIKRRQIEAHKEWMIRSYVVTFGFVTFRWLVALPMWAFLGSAVPATATWLAWVVPLLVAEVVLQWKRTVGAPRTLV